MEDNNIHSKIINQVCREVLIPLGVFQKGASRLYLDDNDYFFTVIEFQPSTWSKGTYLNIGLTFLWNYNQSDVLSFAFSRQPAARYGKFVEYKNETQFRKDVTSLVNIARDEILFYRSFRRIEFAKDWMIAYGSEKALDKADNRELTRYFECVTNVCNDFGWQKLNPYYVFFVLLALYIRKIISPTFLNADEIVAKQNSISETYKNLSPDERQYVMPYYDYLEEFLGVDRSNPPEEFSRLYQWNGSQIAEFSWTFNETVYFSMGQQFPYNEMRRFNGQPMVKPDACKELCRLVILYGGEQEKCER